MPSHLHEGLIELFRHRPSLAAELLADAFAFDIPGYQHAHLSANELNDLKPTEYRADTVVTLANGAGPVLSVVIEVQLGRDPKKRRSWPSYVTTLHARNGCPTVLLVVCADSRTAGWCAEPIRLGHPGFVLTPLVLGPERVPEVTDPEEASRRPELTVLSAIAHGADPEPDKLFTALLRALSCVDRDNAKLYADLVGAALPEAARHRLEAMMSTSTYEYQWSFIRRLDEEEKRRTAEAVAKAKAEGEARTLLMLLETRGIQIPDDARARITECTDLEQLDVWVRRAIAATSIHDVVD